MVRPDTAATRAALAARRLRNRRPNINNNDNNNDSHTASGLEGSSSRDGEGLGSSSWTSVGGDDVTPSSSLDDMATTTTTAATTSDDPRVLRPPAIPSTTARNSTPAATVERQSQPQPQPQQQQLPHHLETVTPKRLSNASAAFSAAAHVASTRRPVMTEPTQDNNSHTNNSNNNITDSVRSSLTMEDNPNTSETSRRRIQFASDTVSHSSSSSSSSPPNSQTMDERMESTTTVPPPPPLSTNDNNDMMSPMRKIHSLLSSLPTNVAEGSNIDFLSPAGGMAGYLKRGNNHDDDNHEDGLDEEDDDFEDTDDEQEELGSDSLDDWGDVIPGQEDVDAMCIPYGSFLMLRSSSVGRHADTNHTVSVTAAKQSLQDGHDDLVDNGTIGGTHHETYMAHADGPGLGRDAERLYIVLAEHVEEFNANVNVNDVNTSFNPNEQSHVLYYGDVVALHSSLANDRALGVRTARSMTDQRDGGGDATAMTTEVGFFRAVLGQAEKWTVLQGGTDKRIHVGATVSSIPKLLDRKLPVRSGEPIVLRNLSTGGLLSIHHRDIQLLEKVKQQQKPLLTVITSAYQMNNGTASTSGNKSVHEYMNSHHLVKPSRYEQFQFVFANAPPCPSWTSARSGDCATGRVYLNGSYLLHPTRDETTDQMEAKLFGSSSIPHNNVTYSNPIGKQSIAMQEKILVDEVIGSMMGLEGHYILARPISSSSSKGLSNDGSKISVGINNVEFQLAPDSVIGGTIDPSLVHLVERILPISTYYVRVNAFVCSHLTRYEYGTVTQALCEAMDILLQEYLTFVSQMEQAFRSTCSPAPSSTFTMNKLYVNIQSSLLTMSILFHIVEEARTCKGGALLNAMLALMTGPYAGDEKGRDVMQFLLEKTSVPYMAMLQGWLEGGEIRDPFHEFMIESTESSALGDDSDWNDWYRVRQEHVPMAFLSPNGQSHMTSQRGKHMEDVVKKILTTGKYWNAVRLCEHKQAHSVHNSGSNGCTASDDTESKTLHYSMGPLQIAEFIDRAYTCASDTLLSLIMKEYDLMETLRTMKRYFLLDQGDFFVHFLDAAEEELKQELSHVSRGRVQSSLSLSVQLSVGNTDDSPQYDKDDEQGQDGVVVKREMLAHQLCCDFSSQSLIDHLDDLHSQSGGIRVQETRTPSQQVYGAYNQALTGVEAFMLDF
eukprot:scaffold29709_cov53-Attheya_sp.AAC.4